MNVLLHNIWAKVHHLINGSELHVYYGITEGWLKYMRKHVSEEEIMNLYKMIMRSEGVIYHGSANQKELCKGISESGFLLYPLVYEEVGCISCMKSMLNGAIPITSKLKESVLKELIKENDLGIENDIKSMLFSKNVNDYYDLYVKRIVDVNRMNLSDIRNKMKKDILKENSLKVSLNDFLKVLMKRERNENTYNQKIHFIK